MDALEEARKTPIGFSEGIGQYVRPSDIPEPYRTQFLHDSLGSTTAMHDGDLVHFARDWHKWLDANYPAR